MKLDNQYYILFAFKTTLESSNSLIIQRLSFSHRKFYLESGQEIKTFSKTINIDNSLNCFVTDLNYIIYSYAIIEKKLLV